MENDIFFEPYKGPKYGKPNNFFNGKKILVIGHNHHCTIERFPARSVCRRTCQTYIQNPTLCKNKTFTVVNDYVEKLKLVKEDKNSQNSNHDRTLYNFGKFLTGNDKLEDIIKAYESIAFYNFCQFGVISQGKKPNKWMYRNSENSLFKVIDLYKPDIILVWGIANIFYNIENHQFTEYSDIKVNGEHIDFRTYEISGYKYNFIGMDHPAKPGYDPFKLRNILKQIQPISSQINGAII